MGRRGRGAGGFKGRGGRCRVVIMGNVEGGIEASLGAALVFNFLLGAFAADEFLSAGVVPP